MADTKKDRRESGRVHVTGNTDEGIPDETYWDDWNDWRDGFRFIGGIDKTKLHSKLCACWVCRRGGRLSNDPLRPEDINREKIVKKERIRAARKKRWFWGLFAL